MLTLHDRILKRAGGQFLPLWLALAFCAGSAMETHAQAIPPPNDDLTNAQGIINASGSALGTNLYATAESGEPAPTTGNPAQASIWYTWTAPYTTEMDFSTSGSTETNGNPLLTVMAVYTLTPGTDLAFANLNLVARDGAYNPASGETTSRVHFFVTFGTTYIIQVDGALNKTTGTNDRGIVNLNWNPSVASGTFAFSSTVYAVGQNESGFAPNGSNPGILDSIDTPEGLSGGPVRASP